MAGKLTLSTLNNDTGVLAVQNGMTGIAKAWVNFNGTGTVAIRDSFNISSVTRNGTGDYTLNFTTAMPNSNYAVQVMGNINLSGNYGYLFAVPYNTAPTTSAVRIATSNTSVLLDMDYVFVAIFSS